MNVTRRKTLLSAGAAVGLAGCLDARLGDGPGGNGEGDGDRDLEFDVFQLGASPGPHLWRYDEDATGFLSLVESDDDRLWMVEDPREVDGLEQWLEDTDFDASTIVYVETAVPSTCYREVAIDDIGIDDGRISGRAEAVDVSDETEGCGAAEAHPSALVRVTGDDLPSDAAFAVTDGWGESSEVVADGRNLDPEHLPGGVAPTGEPEPLAELACGDEDFERHWGPDEAVLGESHVEHGAGREDEDEAIAFAMRVRDPAESDDGDRGSLEFARSDEVRVRTWNLSDQVLVTGNHHKYNLQVSTADGWQDVRGWTTDEPAGYTDEGVSHRPGEGFEWTFEMTEDGVLEGHVHEDRLEVCPDLRPGRYRFVYREAGGSALAVEFEYTA